MLRRIVFFLGFLFAAWIAGSAAASAEDGLAEDVLATTSVIEDADVSTTAQDVADTSTDAVEAVEPVAEAVSTAGAAVDTSTAAVGESEAVRSTVDAVASTSDQSLAPLTDVVSSSADLVDVNLPGDDSVSAEDDASVPRDATDDVSEDAEENTRSEVDAVTEPDDTSPGLPRYLLPFPDDDGAPPHVTADSAPADDSPAGASDSASAVVTGGSAAQGPTFADLTHHQAVPTDLGRALALSGVASPLPAYDAGEPSFAPD